MRALLGALLLVACAGLTASRLPVWRSDEALWLEAHRRSPTLPRPLLNLAAVAVREGRIADAEAWWHRAEASGRMTTEEQRLLGILRCHTAILYGDPDVPLEACS